MLRKGHPFSIALAAAAFALSAPACQAGSDEVPHTEAVSDCGGFHDWSSASFKDASDPNEEYCAAERLHWSFDPETGTLDLAHNRVVLNCCGDHSVDVALIDGVYVVTETDQPGPHGARCGCMCVFDYQTQIQEVSGGVISLKVVLNVTDWKDGSGIVFEGDLDLSKGSGVITIDDVPEETWCHPPSP
jgi:hypothetical protein